MESAPGDLVPLEKGEEGLWTGNPGAGAMLRNARFNRLKGAVLATATVLGLALVARSGWSTWLKMTLAAAAVPLFIIAGLMIAIPIFAKRAHAKTHYALTNRRLLLTSGVGKIETGWFWLRDVTAVEALEEPDGSVSLKVLTRQDQRILLGLTPGEARKAQRIIEDGMKRR